MVEKTAAGVLQELAVKAGTTPKYECVAQTGAQHLSLFEFHCEAFGLKSTGVGRSKKLAKQESAQALLLKMSRGGHCVPAPFCLPEEPEPVVQQASVSNREALENGARGKKRKNGTIANEALIKLNKLAFVKSGEDGPSQSDKDDLGTVSKELTKSSGTGPFPIDELKAKCTSATSGKTANSYKEQEPTAGCSKNVAVNIVNGDSKDVAENIVTEPQNIIQIDYMQELSQVRCAAVLQLADHMFDTKFGRLVLLVRNWQTKFMNIQSSCQLCGLKYEYSCDAVSNVCTVKIEGKIVAQATGATKKLGKEAVENLAWEVLINEAISILVKERFIPHDDAHISFPEMQGCRQPEPREDEFGAPVEPSVAARMMRMMGWQGGGLGADAQGIAEPVRPHLQMINRAGLGSVNAGAHQIEKAAGSVMNRYIASGCIDVDLVFSSDFSMLERKAIHSAAGKLHLVSRSYGKNNERFLVVRKKINVFDLADDVIFNGGTTAKYKIFVPAKLASFYRERE